MEGSGRRKSGGQQNTAPGPLCSAQACVRVTVCCQASCPAQLPAPDRTQCGSGIFQELSELGEKWEEEEQGGRSRAWVNAPDAGPLCPLTSPRPLDTNGIVPFYRPGNQGLSHVPSSRRAGARGSLDVS